MRTAPAFSDTAMSLPARSCLRSMLKPITSRYQLTLVSRSLTVRDASRLSAFTATAARFARAATARATNAAAITSGYVCGASSQGRKATSRSTFLRRPVAAILVEDEARYRSTRIANKGDLCVHALGEEVVVALGPKLHRGVAYARSDMERPVLQRDVELQA